LADIFDIEHQGIQELNKLEWLLTNEIQLCSQRLLKICVAGGIVADEIDEEFLIPNTRAIEITKDSKLYTFSFLNFVSYAITEEMFAQNSDEEVSEGGWVGIYSKSFFLDFVRKSTWATTKFPGELFHYQICTLDHKIDVVTSNHPDFTNF